MLTTDTCVNLELDDYNYTNSPENYFDNPLTPPDIMDFQAGEDFMQELSSGLNIPLLLNSGEDDMNLLNSFLDQSTDEILSEISSPLYPSSPETVDNSVHSNEDIKKDIKKEEMIPNNNNNQIYPQSIQVPQSQILFVKSGPIILPQMEQKMTLNSPKVYTLDPTADPRILKRQLRKIKNRESACLSRKKKKDYLTSLESTVKELTHENLKLKNENIQLKLKLAKYESTCKEKVHSAFLNVKSKVAVCVFLLVLGVNFKPLKFRNSGGNELSDWDNPVYQSHHGRNLLSVYENDTSTYSNKSDGVWSFSMCPAAINQSESARLVLDLERLIGKSSNLTINGNVNLNSGGTNIKVRGKRKYPLHDSLVSSVFPLSKRFRKYPKVVQQNELQLFSQPDQSYSDFFEAINRQDDTFYVVSFSDQHMLLPALYHNRTRRPKMSLIMPFTLVPTNSTQPNTMALMQIDCEVQDTRLLKVDNGAIPRHFRKMDNTTSTTKENNKNEPKKVFKKPIKPFFVNSSGSNNVDDYNFS